MKPGPKPKGKVAIQWTPNFAYAIGLLTADGCLSKDGRHIILTSVDVALLKTFSECLGIKVPLGHKKSSNGNLAYLVQFSDVRFYEFLNNIGLHQAKSKTIKSIEIPDQYFFDFFRGYFDGDGSSYSYYDPKFKNSFRFYISFTCASPHFIGWLMREVSSRLAVTGYISRNKNNDYVQLKYAKKDAMLISHAMYYDKGIPCLKRKRVKIFKALKVIKQAEVA